MKKIILKLISLALKRRKQERLARQIAESHDMLDDYRAARRAGLSPIEALEEWDLLDEWERGE